MDGQGMYYVWVAKSDGDMWNVGRYGGRLG